MEATDKSARAATLASVLGGIAFVAAASSLIVGHRRWQTWFTLFGSLSILMAMRALRARRATKQ